MTPYAKFCTRCGSAVSGEIRFCTQCGQELPEQTPAQPVAEPAPTSAAPLPDPVAVQPVVARAVPPWLLAIGALALVVIAVLGTLVVLGGNVDSKGDDRAARGDTSATSQDADGGRTDESDGELEEADTVDPDPERATRTCWDASTVDDTESCPRPTGRAGLRWVYPSLGDGYDCREPIDAAKVFQRGCLIDVPGYGPTRFAFSEWPSVQSARNHYQSKFGGLGTPAPDGQLRWGPAFTRGSYQVSIAFRDQPFSVSIIAESNAQAAAGARVLRHRSPAEFG